MPNKSGNAYGLTTLCPIINGSIDNQSFDSSTREYLQEEMFEKRQEGKVVISVSLMAKVPNTYLARFFILNDAIYESHPHHLDHLKSKYLVFCSNHYGDCDEYLKGMWEAIPDSIRNIWKHCVGFQGVNDASSFVAYIKKCQVETTFYFDGSNDDALEEQLKSLYLKQEFSDFVFEHQGASEEQLLDDFKLFIENVKPEVLAFPTWKAGVETLEKQLLISNLSEHSG